MGTALTIQQRAELYLPMLTEMAGAYSIPPEWLAGIARVESAFHADAYNGSIADEKRGGSRGLCQMSLQTARAIGFKGSIGSLFDPKVNAKWAAVLISLNMKAFKVSSLEDVAALYNSGKRFADAPLSTRKLYVPAVVRWAAFYKDKAKAPTQAATPQP